MSSSILKFCKVTVATSGDYETGLSDVSFEIGSGDLLLVRIERENERLPLADACQGLLQTEQGTVSFLGDDWTTRSAEQAAAGRGKIGRLFEDEGWISDLNVDENILLSQLHHTHRTEAEIMDEALQFARRQYDELCRDLLLNPNRNPGLKRVDVDQKTPRRSRVRSGRVARRGPAQRSHRRPCRQSRAVRRPGLCSLCPYPPAPIPNAAIYLPTPPRGAARQASMSPISRRPARRARRRDHPGELHELLHRQRRRGGSALRRRQRRMPQSRRSSGCSPPRTSSACARTTS